MLAAGCVVDTYSSDIETHCQENRDCADDLVCLWIWGEGVSTDWGTCEPPLVLGEVCGPWDCELGLHCADPMPDDTDRTMICVEADPVGAPCMGHRTCDTRYCPAGYCAEPPELGEPCPADICAEGYDCIVGTCTE